MVWKRCLLFCKNNALGLSGFVIASGVVLYEKCKIDGNVLASWTTNFEPSVKWDYNWDRRDPNILVKPDKSTEGTTEKDLKDVENEIKKRTPTASRHLLFIRHGQYNTDGKTDFDRYLTELGKKQADLTGQRLKEMGHDYSVLVSSTMTRAKQTADIVAKSIPDVPREETDILREGAPIPPEPPIGNWRPEKNQFYQDGARIEAAFRRYVHRADPEQKTDSFEVVVCHANVIRYFVCRALQLPPEAWLRLSLNHGSITWITVRPSGRVGLRTLGESGFMPADVTSVM
ncbi:PGAM5 [Mytilus edulis]|uniref:Serine/threonine-protein phosphatase PGAM5, mitochondrial n=1 Tax=Mytilus edulis TaxID=6550 RepID=A0A8S3VL35_MYTED|nr:PGAM5 [Mytilus edulis]